MTEQRYLTVNADDFGMSPGINRGILAAHENGIVTSTSLMVRSAAAVDAVSLSHEYPALSVGLHVDLCEWEYSDGSWRLTYQLVSLEDERAVAEEVLGQYERFKELLGREPTHIDSHQHFHLQHPVQHQLLDLAHGVGVPLRHFTPGLQYISRFYGQSAEGDPNPEAISVEALVDVLSSLPPGVSELACHPGDAVDIETRYRSERAIEQRVLCDAAVRAAIARNGITLCSFREVAGFLGLEPQ